MNYYLSKRINNTIRTVGFYLHVMLCCMKGLPNKNPLGLQKQDFDKLTVQTSHYKTSSAKTLKTFIVLYCTVLTA